VGQPVTFCVTTRSDIRDGLERLYHEVYLEYSAEDLMQRTPEDSAYKVLSRGQKIFFISFSVFLVVMGVLFTVPTLTVIMALSTAFYLSFSGYKFYLIYRALQHSLEVPVTDEEVAALDDRELPIYTLLVPLYRETQVLPFLVRGIQRLDYPKEKLDVKLLLEEDDTETIAVARLFNLPSYFDITIVPDGQPKGKPKACNYGLLHARGEYAVIFDAEDIPEPDQLKKVLIAFRKSPPNMVCIQAKLNYFNRNQNVLTKWFTTEYSTWFDLFLPGLDASGAPIPLGGTSNHFKVEALRIAGAWDPFNVTEDADLGPKIFRECRFDARFCAILPERESGCVDRVGHD
jgi:cellulose synthase/poly-beta-1,6-N-acetylglucosamine synthase-like glycosyltransferase